MTRLKSRLADSVLNFFRKLSYGSLMNEKYTSLKTLFAIFVVPLLILRCASTAPSSGNSEYPTSYSQLKLLDLDQMSELLQKKVSEFKRTDNPEALKLGLQLCLSRPDEDDLVEKTISILRNPLEDINQWEASVQEISDKAIAHLKNKEAHSTDQITAGIILENLTAEFKPAFVRQYQSPGFEARIIEKIAAADVEFNSKAISERKLTLMRGAASPSVIAQRLLDERKEFLKKAEKKN